MELKIPPLIVLVLTAAGVMGLNPFWRAVLVPHPINLILGLLVGLAGLSILFFGISAMRRGRTTLNPMQPQTATSLVKTGIFARTRNPIYLAMLLLLSGLAIYLGNALTLIGPLLFVGYMNAFQIEPEERALAQIFGDEYLSYQERVGRWI